MTCCFILLSLSFSLSLSLSLLSLSSLSLSLSIYLPCLMTHSFHLLLPLPVRSNSLRYGLSLVCCLIGSTDVVICPSSICPLMNALSAFFPHDMTKEHCLIRTVTGRYFFHPALSQDLVICDMTTTPCYF